MEKQVANFNQYKSRQEKRILDLSYLVFGRQ